MSAIEVTALQREFANGFKAVDGIDLRVEAGEAYGFLGPNGAGKTTTVRMLVTLLRPTGGVARVAGHDVASEPAAVRRRIGVALQEAALDLLMTGRELVVLQAKLHGFAPTDAQRRGELLIERVGLTEAADRRVGTYSGGMKRRLDLAMALVHEPEVLFLDEPTTGLDPTSRVALWEEVRRLKRDGTTVFLTTQYLEEADQLADRVGIISRGKLVAEGTPAALKADAGAVHLAVRTLDPCDTDRARGVLGATWELDPAGDDGEIAFPVARGAEEIAPVVRALDEAGIAVAALDLREPTLDDVFLAVTGAHLEGSAVATPDGDGDADA